MLSSCLKSILPRHHQVRSISIPWLSARRILAVNLPWSYHEAMISPKTLDEFCRLLRTDRPAARAMIAADPTLLTMTTDHPVHHGDTALH
jgi:hypothetical protein